jgi:hypothetical protein
LLSGKELSDGLRIVCPDADTLVMMSVVYKFKHFVMYVDHEDHIAGLSWDDIVANPVASLPKVLSPRKVEFVEKNERENLPVFYSNLQNIQDFEVGQADNGSSTEGSDSKDLDFVDSDNDMEDDDDLFSENVDDQVVDEGISKGNKIWKGNKVTSRKGKGPALTEEEELSTDEYDLHALDSDGEGQIRMGFKSFRAMDMHNPIFRVGMLLESVEMLRKTTKEYSLKERVDIKMPRNKKKRLKAHCADGCPWALYA